MNFAIQRRSRPILSKSGNIIDQHDVCAVLNDRNQVVATFPIIGKTINSTAIRLMETRPALRQAFVHWE